MVAALLTFALLLLGACSASTIEPCTLACGEDGSCPDGASCGPDGFCKGDGDGSLCGEAAGGTGAGGSGAGGSGTGGTGHGGTGHGGTGTGGTGTGGSGVGDCTSDLDCVATARCQAGRCVFVGPAECPLGAVSTPAGCSCVDGWRDPDRGDGGAGPATECEPIDVKLAVGGRHTCAFTSGFIDQWELVCWGDPAIALDAPPGQQTGIDGFGQGRDLAAGLGHLCAIDRDGGLWCWGDNAFGQCGRPLTEPTVAAPARVAGEGFVSVTAGDHHTCALRADGAAFCFGDDSAAQLGRGASGGPSPTPVRAAEAQSFRSIAAGRAHTCGVTTSGALWCWSTDSAAAAAIGGRSEEPGRPGPASVETNLVTVAAGGDRTCAIFADGKLRCMGEGPLGDGTRSPSSSFVRVREPEGTSKFLDVAVGVRHACGQLRSASGASRLVACWGDNALGAAASGSTLLALAPELHGDASAIGAGWDNSCVDDHGFECSGNNRWGQLGARTVGEALLPTRAGAGSDWELQSLTLGPRGGCGLEARGTLVCWGRNDHGQHSNAPIGSPQTPNEVLGTGTTSVTLGDGFTCAGGTAQRLSGSITCWGRDERGQLGDGEATATPRGNPGPVAGTPSSAFLESALAAGTEAVVVSDRGAPRVEWRWGAGVPTPTSTPGSPGLTKLTANGDVYCGLQDGLPTCRRFTGGEVALPATGLFVELSRGGGHLCGVRPDGEVACTGRNGDGQLGFDATNDHEGDWVTVRLPGPARLVAAGEAHTCALAGTPGQPGVDGVVWCWGRNDRGQLGTGDLLGRTAPTSVDEGRRFTFVAAGADFTCGVDAAGEPWCWGNNDHGELGNGRGLAERFIPVQP